LGNGGEFYQCVWHLAGNRYECDEWHNALLSGSGRAVGFGASYEKIPRKQRPLQAHCSVISVSSCSTPVQLRMIVIKAPNGGGRTGQAPRSGWWCSNWCLA